MNKNNLILSFANANDQELIGGIGAMPNQDVNRFTAEIGYWLDELFWNKGVIYKSIPTFCGYLFNNFEFNHLLLLFMKLMKPL